MKAYGWVRRCLVTGVTLLSVVVASAGERPDRYGKVRFPCYSSKTGMLTSEILAVEADAKGLSAETTKINMRGVTIRVFKGPEPGAPLPTEDRAPPIKSVITSREGQYERIASHGQVFEDIAHLKGDVHVVRYTDVPKDKPDARPLVETEIFCDNATWDHTREILMGTGPVTIKQPGTVLKGYNLFYEIKERQGPGRASASGVEMLHPEGEEGKYGGEIILRGPVRMVTQRELEKAEPATPHGKPGEKPEEDTKGKPTAAPEAVHPTVVTAKGVAIYDLDSRVVQFQEAVKVDRRNMDIDSDCLRVLMMPKEQTIQEMIAWGNVTIRGKPSPAGGETAKDRSTSYIAHGDYARYVAGKEHLFLRDRRRGHKPDVIFGDDRIADRELVFDTRNGELVRLTTEGGLGEALLHRVETTPTAAGKPAVVKKVPTHITYKRGAVYLALEDRAVFVEKVHLVQRELTLDTDKLNVTLEPAADGEGAQRKGIRSLEALGNVVIQRTESRATAKRAVLDRRKNILRLFGPPHPQIEQPGSHRLTSPEIEILERERVGEERSRGVITGTGGPGSFVFLPRPAQGSPAVGRSDDIAVESESIRIRYDHWMRYNESTVPLRAEFHKNVVADTETYVLRSDDLDVILVEEKAKDAKGDETSRTVIQRIIATGNATLHSGEQHFKARRIVRDVPQRVVTLYGDPKAKGAAAWAEAWEEDGVHFRAPRIVAKENEAGNTIHAEGPGEIVLPDGAKGEKAIVRYVGDAVYEELPNKTGKAIFHKDVVMVRQATGMVVRSDEMEAYIEADPVGAEATEPGRPKRPPRRLRRDIVRRNVVVTQGQRVAYGTEGELFVRDSGDVIQLRGSKKRLARVRDREGLHLYAPRITVLQSTGVVTAIGPGRMYVTSTEPLQHLGVEKRGETARVNYLVLYDGEVKYNSLARKIKFRENVRLEQENVWGRCEYLILNLEDAPEGAGAPGEEGAPTLQVKSAEAEERVRFKRFEPAKFKSDEKIARIDRPGKTVYTKSERGFYDIATQTVRLFGGPPDAEAIQQTNTIDDEGNLRRSRVHMVRRIIILNLASGNIRGEPRTGKLEFVRNAGPLAFEDE